MGTEWERDGNGVGVGTGTPFRDKPPLPPVVSKWCVESGEFNKRATSKQPGGGGGGGGACLERVC